MTCRRQKLSGGGATLVQLDISTDAAPAEIARVITENAVEAVIHFAAKKQVGEIRRTSALLLPTEHWWFGQRLGRHGADRR